MARYLATTSQRIDFLEKFAEQWSSDQICRAHPDWMEEWLELVNCQGYTIWGQRFDDLFPKLEVAAYRDCKGHKLSGMRMMYVPEEQRTAWQIISPDTLDLRIEDQMNYIRLRLLPRLAAGILHAYTPIMINYRNDLIASEQAETDKFFKDLKKCGFA